MRKIYAVLFGPMLLFVACNTGTKNEAGGADSTTRISSTTSSSGESKEERNKEVAMASIKALINQDVDETLKNVTANSVDYNDGSGPVTKGKDSIRAGMQRWMGSMQNYKGENLEALADGNKVMVYGDWTGTFKNDFMGMKTAGKTFKVKDVDIFTFDDSSKITEHRSVQSVAGMMASMEKADK